MELEFCSVWKHAQSLGHVCRGLGRVIMRRRGGGSDEAGAFSRPCGPSSTLTPLTSLNKSLCYGISQSERDELEAGHPRARGKLLVVISCFSWSERRRQAHCFSVCEPFSIF